MIRERSKNSRLVFSCEHVINALTKYLFGFVGLAAGTSKCEKNKTNKKKKQPRTHTHHRRPILTMACPIFRTKVDGPRNQSFAEKLVNSKILGYTLLPMQYKNVRKMYMKGKEKIFKYRMKFGFIGVCLARNNSYATIKPSRRSVAVYLSSSKFSQESYLVAVEDEEGREQIEQLSISNKPQYLFWLTCVV